MWLIAYGTWTVFSNAATFRDNFILPKLSLEQQKSWSTLALIPHLDWRTWLLGMMAITILIVMIGAFREHKRKTTAINAGGGSLPELPHGIHVNVNPTFNNNPHTEVNTPVNLSQSQGHPQPEPQPERQVKGQTLKEPPRLEYTGHEVKRLHYDTRNNQIAEGESFHRVPSEYLREANVVFAQFYYEPDEDTYNWVKVKAHILYYNEQNELLRRLIESVWYPEESCEITFTRATAYELVIAWAGTSGIGAYECRHTERPKPYFGKLFTPKLHTLNGKGFFIQVQLIVQRDEDVLLRKTFPFRLVLEPEIHLKIADAEQRKDAITVTLNTENRVLEIARNLNDYLNEGHSILNSIAHNMGADMSSISSWEVKVSAYIAAKLGELRAMEFDKQGSIKQYPHPAVNRALVDHLYTRLERIGDVITELRNS